MTWQLFKWLRRRSPPEDDPIPAEVAKVKMHTEELKRLIEDLRQATLRERRP